MFSGPYDHEVMLVRVILSISDEPEMLSLFLNPDEYLEPDFSSGHMIRCISHRSVSVFFEYSEKNTVSFMLLLNETISISFHAEDKIRCNCNE